MHVAPRHHQRAKRSNSATGSTPTAWACTSRGDATLTVPNVATPYVSGDGSPQAVTPRNSPNEFIGLDVGGLGNLDEVKHVHLPLAGFDPPDEVV